MLTVGICTLGCKVNQYESEAIAEALKKVDQMMIDFPDAKFPGASSKDNVYKAYDNNTGWQSGFRDWPFNQFRIGLEYKFL